MRVRVRTRVRARVKTRVRARVRDRPPTYGVRRPSHERHVLLPKLRDRVQLDVGLVRVRGRVRVRPR